MKRKEPYFGWCDVKGCRNEGCSGGNVWRNEGYWTVCYEHSESFRNGDPMPEMKKGAIRRELLRDKNTQFLPEKLKKTTFYF